MSQSISYFHHSKYHHFHNHEHYHVTVILCSFKCFDWCMAMPPTSKFIPIHVTIILYVVIYNSCTNTYVPTFHTPFLQYNYIEYIFTVGMFECVRQHYMHHINTLTLIHTFTATITHTHTQIIEYSMCLCYVSVCVFYSCEEKIMAQKQIRIYC